MKGLAICLAFLAALARLATAEEPPGPGAPKAVRVNGVELHYVDQGKGVPVVFVHGGLEDYRAWQAQMGPFSERYRAIAYSRRYNYPNTAGPLDPDYSARTDAEDLAALITTLKLGPAHVIAVSYGAYTALLLAEKHPALVRSLVLSEPPVLRWLPALEGGKPLFDDVMAKLWEPATRGFRQSDAAGVTAAIDGFGELGYSGTDQKLTFAALPPEVRSMLLDNAPEWRALTRSRDAFPELPLDAVRRIKAPTLLLSGERSVALHGLLDRQLETLLPNSQRIVMAKATHEMWNEFPAECRSAALAFIARH